MRVVVPARPVVIRVPPTAWGLGNDRTEHLRPRDRSGVWLVLGIIGLAVAFGLLMAALA